MSEWDEDYEDDFEEELSSRSGKPSSSARVTHTTATSAQSPSTGVTPVRGNGRFSLETSFESYASSGNAGGGVLAASARELSTPSSKSASSRHSDPLYPTEEPRKQAGLHTREDAYPAEPPSAPAAMSSPHHGATAAATHAASSSRFSSNAATSVTSSHNTAQQQRSSRFQSPAYASGAPAAAFESYESTPADSPGRAAPQRRSASATSSSSGTHSAASDERQTSGQTPFPYQQQNYPAQPSPHLSNPRSSAGHSAAGKQSHSDTPGPMQGTSTAAMVATPNTRDVSGPRHNSLSDENNNNSSTTSNKKKAIHQSNYTTVEELDDTPLPQYKGRAPTMDDEELSSVDDEEKAEEHEGTRYSPLHGASAKQEADVRPAPVAAPLSPPSLPRPRTPTPPASSRASSPTASEGYSDNFSRATPLASSAHHPTPSIPIGSRVSSTTAAATPPRFSLKPASSRSESEARASLTARTPSTTSEEAYKKPTPALEMSLGSEMKNRTAPYSGPGPQGIRQHASSSSSSTSSKASSEQDDGAERAQLLLRLTDLQSDITTWENRIARKRAAMAASTTAQTTPAKSPISPAQRRGRSGSSGGLRNAQQQRGGSKAPPTAARRTPSNGRGRGGRAGGRAAGAGGGRGITRQRSSSNDKDRPITKARLEAIRETNRKLEAAYLRLGGDGSGGATMDVSALVARADAQLQRARARLKEVNAARRALENRDKRAAHTIEEVHRRMPSTTELQERQLNEGIYSRTGLQRTLKELRDNIDRTRTGTQLMASRCAELATQVEELHLSSMNPKDYEALRATRDARKKAVDKLRTAIAVYSAAVAQDGRGGGTAATPTAGGGGGGGLSGRSSRATSPRKTSLSGGPSNLGMDNVDDAKAALLADQQVTLLGRRQELQDRIEELRRRIEQRNDQIKANNNISSSGGGAAAFYIVGGNPQAADAALASGSGAAAVRKSSLRHVLQAPAGKQANARASPSPSREPVLSATPTTSELNAARGERSSVGRNSAAAERLRGAVAAARQDGKHRRKDNPAPPLRDLLPSEPPAEKNARAPVSTSTGTGQRTVRSSPQPSSSTFTALADSPTKGSASWKTATASPGEPAAQDAKSLPLEEPIDEDEGDDVDDAGIEAMLRRIDEDNRRIGEEVFGGASHSPSSTSSPQPTTKQQQQQQQHDPDHQYSNNKTKGTGEAGGLFSEPGAISPASMRADDPEAFGDEAMDEELEEEEEGVNAGEGSGRSTPEWLREI